MSREIETKILSQEETYELFKTYANNPKAVATYIKFNEEDESPKLLTSYPIVDPKKLDSNDQPQEIKNISEKIYEAAFDLWLKSEDL